MLETSDRLEVTAAERIEFAPVNQYTILAQLFARAAATGGPAPIPLEDSIKNMAVLDALRRSATSGALGDRLIAPRRRAGQPSSRSSRLPMLTTASSTNPMPR